MPLYFPKDDIDNKVITIVPENNKGFGLWVRNILPNIGSLYGSDNQLPLKIPSQFKPEENYEKTIVRRCENLGHHVGRDGISDWILKKSMEKYTIKVTKANLFHYIYGFLHSPCYCEKYAETLTKQAPSIPLVKEDSFWQYAKIGKELVDIHLDYENQPKLHEVEVSGEEHGNFTVRKMQFAKEDKSSIKFNDDITISNIPAKAYDYLITDKSAIWWVMNQYEATIGNDKKYRNRKQSAHRKDEKDIPNDPNIYAQEIGNPRYILDLLLSVITLSVKTLELVEQLPKDIE